MAEKSKKNPAAVALGRLGGRVGGPARARKLTSEQRSEIARNAAKARWIAKKEKGEIMISWEKTLTASEAVRPSQGAEMPFIRYTQANHDIDHCRWFRESLFGRAGWTRKVGQRESIVVPFDVTIDGNDMGQQSLEIDYDPAREEHHRAPTVHIHYNGAVGARLNLVDMTGHLLTITASNGRYTLDIS